MREGRRRKGGSHKAPVGRAEGSWSPGAPWAARGLGLLSDWGRGMEAAGRAMTGRTCVNKVIIALTSLESMRMS